MPFYAFTQKKIRYFEYTYSKLKNRTVIIGSRRLPVQHLSIRVPWHDAGWTGSICRNPTANTACRVLKRIAKEKDDAAEQLVKGKSFNDLPSQNNYPPCIRENSSFMASFPIEIKLEHPYKKNNTESHRHFLPTPYTIRPFSASCLPYRWIYIEKATKISEIYKLGFQSEQEPKLNFESDWIQERSNQLVLLDTFFSAIRPNTSLCFFYAKDTPLSLSARRTIVGVGLVRRIHDPVEYLYSTSNPSLRSILWERNVEHSIRPDFKEGFYFPYQELFELANQQGLNPEYFLATVPDEAFSSFSYGSEHVTHEEAIASTLSCLRAIDRLRETPISGPWEQVSKWLNEQLDRLWQMRGSFPGFVSALSAFLDDAGEEVAYEITDLGVKEDSDKVVDPWPVFDQVMQSPSTAPEVVRNHIGEGYARTWREMPLQRKELLKLLSQFSLTPEQVKRNFDCDCLSEKGITEISLVDNPYLLYGNYIFATP